MEQLHNITALFLSHNQITTIQGLEQLHNITELYLHDNRITAIQGLEQLHNITALSLSGNQITTIQGLEQLHKITKLYLHDNQITTIQGLEQLHNITALSLHDNQITTIQGLEQLHNITTLSLQYNQITAIQGLEQLHNITTLNLQNNPITNLYFTEQFSNLSHLPLFWKDISQNNFAPGIYLKSCHQLVEPSPPWVKLGKKAVQEYFQAIREQGKVTLREAKIMLIGRPNMGKTTLSRKLRDKNSCMPPSNFSTKGIVVDNWEYTWKGKNYTVRIWDFGGQDIQYSLHQFFMTERAIYGLLDSTREYQDQAAGGDLYANYWLQTIEKLANGSPTFHIYNHHKGQQKNTSIHHSLCEQYAFLEKEPLVVDLLHVNQEVVEQKQLERLQAFLQKAVAELPNVGLVLPKRWAAVRQVLLDTAQTKAIITLKEYQQICQQQGITNKEVMLVISSYLHEVGSIIHYNKEKTSPLYKLLILQRNWATEAVYKVALSPLVSKQSGIFERKDLEQIWQADQGLSPEQAESYQEHLAELLALLQQFEVCYPYKKNQFLVPQLVPTKRPSQFPIASQEALQLEYRYPFMPYGLIYRLAVRLHRYIQDKEIWGKGLILTNIEQDQKGWIVLTEERRQQQGSIHLSIHGNKKARYFLQQQIEQELQDLHHIFNLQDQVHLLVPCICSSCTNSPTPFAFYYQKELLAKLQASNDTTIECRTSWKKVSILALIDHAFEERPRVIKILAGDKKSAPQNISIHNHNHWDQSKKNVIEGDVDNSGIDMGDRY